MIYDLKTSWAQLIDENINIIECIRLFEEGYDRIFITDKSLNYFGMVIEKENFSKVWEDDNETKWITYLSEEDYIYDISSDDVINKKAQKLYSKRKISTIPIVVFNKIEFVLINQEAKVNEIYWKMVRIRDAIYYLSQYKNLYISALSNDKLMSFYKMFIDFFDIQILSDTNIDELLNDKNNLLIYDVDLYDNLNINKIALKELDKIFIYQYINFYKPEITIKNSWASVNLKEFSVLDCISLFDEGHNSIYIEDENNKFVSTICRHNFKEDFFQNAFKRWPDAYIDYSQNTDVLYYGLIKAFNENRRQELPILKKGKIVANCCMLTFDIPLKWEYISESSVQEYFGEREILLSSDKSELKNFYNRYKNHLHLTILDSKDELNNFFNGKFDVVIYASDIWCDFNTLVIDIRQVYLDLLGKYVKELLDKKEIKYYYLEVPKHNYEVLNYNKRQSKRLIKKITPRLNHSYIATDEYYIYPDLISENCNIVNGIRKTFYNPTGSSNNILFFGACTSIGYNVSDENTIESHLQGIINKRSDRVYKVVNAGGIFGGSISHDINILYIILKHEYKQGDIVIQFGFNMWNSSFIHKADGYYKLTDLFNQYDNRYQCYFGDWVGHLNILGNQAVAEYIYNIVFCGS